MLDLLIEMFGSYVSLINVDNKKVKIESEGGR